MTLTPPSLILWTGPKHSGKTTSIARLVQTARVGGFVAAGCLAPSVCTEDRLIGFDIVDLRTGRRTPLARRETGQETAGRFRFLATGLELGTTALGPAATHDADLIIIDEFGPWELESGGWRVATDRLLTSCATVLLLVVREELAERVAQLYEKIDARRRNASQPESAADVLMILSQRRDDAIRNCKTRTSYARHKMRRTGSIARENQHGSLPL